MHLFDQFNTNINIRMYDFVSLNSLFTFSSVCCRCTCSNIVGTLFFGFVSLEELKSKKSETTQSFPRLQKKWVHWIKIISLQELLARLFTQQRKMMCAGNKIVCTTESMFKKFMVDQNSAMMAMKKSFDAMNNLI